MSSHMRTSWEEYAKEAKVDQVPSWIVESGVHIPLQLMIRLAYERGYQEGGAHTAFKLADEFQARAALLAHDTKGWQTVVTKRAYPSAGDTRKVVCEDGAD